VTQMAMLTIGLLSSVGFDVRDTLMTTGGVVAIDIYVVLELQKKVCEKEWKEWKEWKECEKKE